MKKARLSLTLALTVSASLANSATLYVKTNGTGTNCTSWADACATIAGAAGKAAAGVDPSYEIHIAKGIYKFTSTLSVTLSVSDKSLIFIGGYDAATDTQVGDKFSTIITGDNDNNDTKDTRGITKSYSGINGTNTSKAVLLGTGSYTFKHMTFTGFKGAQADDHGTVIFYQNPTGANNTLTLNDVALIGNANYSMGNIMVYASSPNAAYVVIDDGWFENNAGDAGVVLTTHLNVPAATISNSLFKGNVSAKDAYPGWNYGIGAVWGQGSTSLKVISSSFSNNTASDGPSAIQADGPLEITNSTFADNISGQTAAIKTAGVTTIRYSTIYSNDGNGSALSGGIQHGNGAANSLSLFGNLILANKKAGVDSNIQAANGSIKDLGYNLLGYGGLSYVTGTFTKHANTEFPVVGEADIVVGHAYHGGQRESVKIKKAGPARNKIPNDGIPFYGVGKSADYPFTSLSQAHGALKSVSGYDAGVYFFDLGGSYDTSSTPYTYTAGADANGQFATYVDDQGYVLMASADIAQNAANYTQTSSLDLRADAILKSSVFSHAKFDVSEVRISAKSDGARGSFDGYSVSSNVISKIKAFQTLPNTAETGGTWVVTYSTTGKNYFTGTARAAADQSKSLAQEIYYANTAASADGISWVPLSNKEALANITNTSAANFDSLDLWVRGNSGLCNGSLTNIDARGMPRSDRVSEEDPMSACDIGGFEFNDYYKIDCVDEDGLRPENTISKYSAGLCFNDPNAVTPKAVLENFAGAIHPFYLLLLAITGLGLRRGRYSV